MVVQEAICLSVPGFEPTSSLFSDHCCPLGQSVLFNLSVYLLSDLPTVTGDLTASVSGNDITFTWKSLEGTFTKVEIHKCTSSCSPIFETSDPSTTSATVSVEYSSDAQFRLAFYQGDELVNEEYFAVKVGEYAVYTVIVP